MPNSVASDLPVGLTEAARRERERFVAMYQSLLTRVQTVALSILVWGPSPESGTAVAQKRIAIRDELLRLGHNAMFSEDLSASGARLSEKAREFAQARTAHLIIILVEGAPGALAEAHDFCNDPDIAPNVFVLIPSKYKRGYSARGAIRELSEGFGGVAWYNDKELASCNVLKRAIARAEARRHILYRARGGLP